MKKRKIDHQDESQGKKVRKKDRKKERKKERTKGRKKESCLALRHVKKKLV